MLIFMVGLAREHIRVISDTLISLNKENCSLWWLKIHPNPKSKYVGTYISIHNNKLIYPRLQNALYSYRYLLGKSGYSASSCESEAILIH